MKVKHALIKEVGFMGRSAFSPSPQRKKRGMLASLKLWMGCGGVGWWCQWGGAVSIFLSSKSILPCCLQPCLFRELGIKCVCVLKVALIEIEQSGTPHIVSTPAPHRCLTPPSSPFLSWDKECPECLASPAVSNNWRIGWVVQCQRRRKKSKLDESNTL